MPSEDIEDILENTSLNHHNYDYNNTNNYEVKLKYRPRKSNNNNVDVDDNVNDTVENNEHLNYENFLPGKHSIYVRNWGCTHNTSDSEYMMGLLAQSGYQLVDQPEKADLWILNSCTVKTPAEDHFRNEINRALKMNKKLVVSGCVPQSDYRETYLKNLSIIGVQQIDKVVEVVEETLKNNVVHYLAVQKLNNRKTGGASLHMPKIRRNPFIEIIAINTGCLNECTYCKTKHARGKLGSYPIEDIIQRAKCAFDEGVKELWITSEDTGAYGKDIGTSLPELMKQLVKVVPDDCMVRIGMTNPPYILEHLESMAEILSHPRVYSFLHIPVQAGSDFVLSDMKRQYLNEDFCQIVDFLKEKVPGITIATDIICGFPTETEKDFEETIKLIEKYKFPTLFINQFYPRPGTPAAKMKRLHNNEIKKRSRQASELFNSYLPYENRIGKRYQVLITEESKDKKLYVGHNKFYEQILINKGQDLMGKWCQVEIQSTGKHFMIGKLITTTTTTTLIDTNNKTINNKNISGFRNSLITSCLIISMATFVLFKIFKRF